MQLIATYLERVFVFEQQGQTVRLSDPDASLSPQAVLNFYAATYPILTTARIEGPRIVDDCVQYTFTATLGTKG